MFFFSNLPKMEWSEGRSRGRGEGGEDKNRAIVCETNYPKEFMKIVHAWMDFMIRFIEVKWYVAWNHQTSLGD